MFLPWYMWIWHMNCVHQMHWLRFRNQFDTYPVCCWYNIVSLGCTVGTRPSSKDSSLPGIKVLSATRFKCATAFLNQWHLSLSYQHHILDEINWPGRIWHMKYFFLTANYNPWLQIDTLIEWCKCWRVSLWTKYIHIWQNEWHF